LSWDQAETKFCLILIQSLILLLLLTALLLLSACSSDPASPEEEIRQFIKQGIAAAEARDAGTLEDMVTINYRDTKGYNRKQLGKLLRLYFFRHKNIYLFDKIESIQLIGSNEAIVHLHVAMAGSVISDASMLANLRAQIYRFELQMVKQGEWLLQQASWQRASARDLQ